MNKCNIKNFFLLVYFGCFYYGMARKQDFPELPVLSSDDINKISGLDEKRFDLNLLKDVHKFVFDAKNSGIIDENVAKILIAYSILNKVSTEEIQKFIMAAELVSVSQTRAINYEVSFDNQKNNSHGEVLMWVGTCSVFIVAICALYLLLQDRSKGIDWDEVKYDLKNGIMRAYKAGRDLFDRARRSMNSKA